MTWSGQVARASTTPASGSLLLSSIPGPATSSCSCPQVGPPWTASQSTIEVLGASLRTLAMASALEHARCSERPKCDTENKVPQKGKSLSGLTCCTFYKSASDQSKQACHLIGQVIMMPESNFFQALPVCDLQQHMVPWLVPDHISITF